MPGSCSRPTVLVGRLGGQEFGILLPATDLAGARQVAERFRREVAHTPTELGQSRVAITISVGVAELEPDDPGPNSVLERADAALYRAKRRGRNRVEMNCLHSDEALALVMNVGS